MRHVCLFDHTEHPCHQATGVQWGAQQTGCLWEAAAQETCIGETSSYREALGTGGHMCGRPVLVQAGSMQQGLVLAPHFQTWEPHAAVLRFKLSIPAPGRTPVATTRNAGPQFLGHF